jgi:hypothetical protein
VAVTLSREDAEHLKLLSLGHYVVAGFMGLLGFFPIFHLAVGLWVIFSPETMRTKSGGPPPALLGGIFVGFALVFMLGAWSVATCLFLAARNLARRRRRTFCLVVAFIGALTCMPLGTILGALTIMVLIRPAVRDAFDQVAAPDTGLPIDTPLGAS